MAGRVGIRCRAYFKSRMGRSCTGRYDVFLILFLTSSFLPPFDTVITSSPWTLCRRSAVKIVKAFHWPPQWKTFGALDLDALILQFGCRQRAGNTSKDDQNRAADGLHVPHPVSRALFVSLHYHFNLFYFILISPI